MKIEGWRINQSSIGKEMFDNTARTEVSFVTDDEIDRDTLLNYIRLYDKSTATPIDIDLGFYQSMKKFAEEDEKLYKFYDGKSPSQIKEICDEIYNRIHKFLEHNMKSPQINWKYRQFTTGIDILRAYNIWWTPPSNQMKNKETR